MQVCLFFRVKFGADSEQLSRSIERFCPTLSLIITLSGQMMKSNQLKSRWNFVKTKTTTPGNNIYTLFIPIMAFTSFISSKFQTLFLPYKLSYYAWATCDRARDQITHFPCPVLVTSITKWVWSSVAVKYRLRPVYRLCHSPSSETRSVHCELKISVSTRTCACHL